MIVKENFIFNIPVENKKTSGIYRICQNIDNRIYVGSAQNFWKRFNSHSNELKAGMHRNYYLQNFYNYHLQAIYTFEIIELVDLENLVKREQFWLNETKCYKHDLGFNICPVAYSCLGRITTKETKEKISGKNHHRFGKPLPSEIKEKISKANIGNKSWSFRKNPSLIGLKIGPLKNSIPIVCIDINEIVSNFNSITEAAKALTLDKTVIAKVCKGIYKQYKGYKFIYKSEYLARNPYIPQISLPPL